MEIPDWLRGMAAKVAQGAKLIPSEQDNLRARQKSYAERRTNVYDRKTAVEDDVRKLEARLLKLDARRQTEHGILQRATVKEMQAVGVQLKGKEQLLTQAITDIADLDTLISNLDQLLSGQPVRAEDWDEVGVDMEDLLQDAAEAAKAREQVQGLAGREQRDLAGEVHVDELLGEIRGPAQAVDADTDQLLKRAKQKQSPEPEA
jgi:hypothetical protein